MIYDWTVVIMKKNNYEKRMKFYCLDNRWSYMNMKLGIVWLLELTGSPSVPAQ